MDQKNEGGHKPGRGFIGEKEEQLKQENGIKYMKKYAEQMVAKGFKSEKLIKKKEDKIENRTSPGDCKVVGGCEILIHEGIVGRLDPDEVVCAEEIEQSRIENQKTQPQKD
jgi:hypothetical protein